MLPSDDQLPSIIETIAPPAPAAPTGTYIVPVAHHRCRRRPGRLALH